MVRTDMADFDVIIVGAGIAGLTCAEELRQRDVDFLLLEASDTPGGRITTDRHEGFLLDRGFQVFLTAYPEAQRVLNYDTLKLNRFEPGALIWYDGAFRRLSDPWRRPGQLLGTAISPAASVLDKMRIAKLRSDTTSGDLQQLYQRAETTTLEMLKRRGFSSIAIERFFRPFLGGIFLEKELATSSRLGEFVFRMFSQGDAALPADGMQAIPRQLVERLPDNVLRLNTPAKEIRQGAVELADGQQLTAGQIVVATDAPTASRLTGHPLSGEANHVDCYYFAAEKPPMEEPILMLNGEGQGPVNNVCVPSQVARNYAPPGQSLISVTALEGADVEGILQQLRTWFGAGVDQWRHLKTYHIRYALPRQTPPELEPVAKSPLLSPGNYRCGDYCDTASINGAMASGRRAAEAVIQDLVASSTGSA